MWHLYGFVPLAGIANTVEAGQNGALFKGLADSLTAGLIVAALTVTSLLVVGLLSGQLTWPTTDQAVAMPWWAWLGGILGGSIILAQLFIARQIGAASFIGLLVTAGVVASIVLDNYGWVVLERHAELLQGGAHRQVRLLDQLDDLQLLRGRVPHASSSPAPVILFFSRRFSRTRSATTSFSAPASRRRS